MIERERTRKKRAHCSHARLRKPADAAPAVQAAPPNGGRAQVDVVQPADVLEELVVLDSLDLPTLVLHWDGHKPSVQIKIRNSSKADLSSKYKSIYGSQRTKFWQDTSISW